MKNILSYIGLFISVGIWSLSFVSIDFCLAYMTTTEVNVIRFVVGSTVLWLLYFIRGVKFAFYRKDQMKIAFAGIFGTAGYYFFENIGLIYLEPSSVSIITGAIPILTLVVAMLFTGMKTRFRNIVYIFMSFIGIIILANPFNNGVEGNFKGIVLVLVADLCWVIYTLINKPLTHKYDRLNLLTIQIFYGAIIFIGIYTFEVSNNVIPLMDYEKLLSNGELVWQMLFLGIMSTIVVYHLYNYALCELGVTISALFINVIPVATLLLGVALQLETFSFGKVIGCIFVVLAVYLIDDI